MKRGIFSVLTPFSLAAMAIASFLDHVLPLRLRTLSATLAHRTSSRAWRESSEQLIFDNAGTDTSRRRRITMPGGDKSSYTDKKAEHIEDSYEDHGISYKEAEHRAWRTRKLTAPKSPGLVAASPRFTRPFGKAAASVRQSAGSRTFAVGEERDTYSKAPRRLTIKTKQLLRLQIQCARLQRIGGTSHTFRRF
jgi:hypothetical protein